MTEEELAMAYADGELDAINAKRFEKQMAERPELAATVAAHRALRNRLRNNFAAIAEAPLPLHLTALLDANVVELRPKARFVGFWRVATAIAACLVAAVIIGQFWQRPSMGGTGLQMASTPLAHALDQQFSGSQGKFRMLVSFQDRRGKFCRVFTEPERDGIACREEQGWTLRQTQPHASGGVGEYRQAASSEAELLAAAQGMMAGDPLDTAAERAAQGRGWRD